MDPQARLFYGIVLGRGETAFAAANRAYAAGKAHGVSTGSAGKPGAGEEHTDSYIYVTASAVEAFDGVVAVPPTALASQPEWDARLAAVCALCNIPFRTPGWHLGTEID